MKEQGYSCDRCNGVAYHRELRVVRFETWSGRPSQDDPKLDLCGACVDGLKSWLDPRVNVR